MTAPARFVVLDRVVSTNDEARRLAAEGAADGTVILAREQTGGRGRQGRAWASPPGNVYSSFVLRPGVPAARAAELGFVAALAVAETVATLAPPGVAVTCKWPNDVLASGRKIAGILPEASLAADGRIDHLVIGIGLNVAHHPGDTAWPATSLRALGAAAEADEAAAALVGALGRWRALWEREGFAPVRAAWLARAAGLGADIRVRLGAGDLVGRFAGLDEKGALLLDRGAGGISRVAAGDVLLSAG
jgi:BirA family transcriptional regulator, biotin operon repressor / biotin---[acetyl-CoA-carboxylase] ligase